MGCGNSRSKLAAEDPSSTEKTRRQSVYAPAPEIPITVGENVKLDSSGSSSIKIVFIFGGPGSGKGRIVTNLKSMFGMKLITIEETVLKYLPKKMQHTMTLENSMEIADLVKKEPSHTTLQWALRLMQHNIESSPNHLFLVDAVPNLKWMARNEFLMKEDCSTELAEFEQKTPISFAIDLSITEESLFTILDYSHHSTVLPPGATVNDDADNSRAKRRYQTHIKATQPFLNYFASSNRLVSINVSCGAVEPIWECVHKFCTCNLNLHAWRPVDTVLVFAMDGMTAGNLDMECSDMRVIRLSEVATDPMATMDCLLKDLSDHIDKLADDSHYFVIDPSNTTIAKPDAMELYQPTDKHSIVFSDVKDENEGCFNQFCIRLNGLIGGENPYFKAVCCSEDETLLFPANTDNEFCKSMAICMAEKHPSKQ